MSASWQPGWAKLFTGRHIIILVADDPELTRSYYGWAHAWSARIYEEIKRQFPIGGPDVVEFQDCGSMRQQLELMAASDPRISFHDALARRAVPSLIREHHVTVVPSLWECWPAAALESIAYDRPVLATPTGGLAEIVRPAIRAGAPTGPMSTPLRWA
jgi:glycosyltransferase involved in cell wall biosynthesis